jgi:hypothetical protein
MFDYTLLKNKNNFFTLFCFILKSTWLPGYRFATAKQKFNPIPVCKSPEVVKKLTLTLYARVQISGTLWKAILQYKAGPTFGPDALTVVKNIALTVK